MEIKIRQTPTSEQFSRCDSAGKEKDVLGLFCCENDPKTPEKPCNYLTVTIRIRII